MGPTVVIYPSIFRFSYLTDRRGRPSTNTAHALRTFYFLVLRGDAAY